MTDSRRALRIAILSSLLALGFAFSLFAMARDSSMGLGNDDGSAGVIYTFDEYWCSGTTTQYQQCAWIGTVTSNGVVEATDVQFRDAVVEGVSPGYQVPALWSYRDPLNAWSIEGSRAWLNNVASTVAAAVFMLAMLVSAIYWWRRFGRDKAEEATAAPKEPTSKKPVKAPAS
ncbi:MAG: hypothetical protein WC054_01815 [Candidatus Nanopelagicales bacterium]